MKNLKVVFGILVPVIFSIFAILSLWQLTNYKKAVTRIEFSEAIVHVAKYMAQVRGFTYVYAHLSEHDQNLIDIISDASRQLDKFFVDTLEYAKNLDSNEYRKLVGIQEELEKLQRISEISGKNARIQLSDKSSMPALEWFENVSILISSLEKIHIANLERLDEDRKWLEMPGTISSTMIRKAIWSLLELAGQERALIGAAIAQKTVIPKEKINAKWIRIKKAWLVILDSMQGRLSNIELASAIQSIENSFFGEYNKLRQKAMLASPKGENYPLSAGQWLTQSTNSIDALITMSELLSRNDVQTIAGLKLEFSKKRKSVSIVGIIVILISIIYILFYFVELLNYKRRFRKVKKLYQISEDLLLSASELALERGISRAMIASTTDIGENLIQKVVKQREIIGSKLLPALEDLQGLQIAKHNYLIDGVRKTIERVTELREDFDKCLGLSARESSSDLAKQIFEEFTTLIESTEELQLSAAHSFALDGQKTGFWSSNAMWYKNLAETAALRHFIWIMSEYAGRQRALIGSAISSENCIPLEKIEPLQNEVLTSWKIVKLEVNRGKNNEEVRKALEIVKNYFFAGEYPEKLKKVIDCSRKNSGKPCYNIETDQWFDISSKAIEAILDLSHEVGKNSEQRLSRMINKETLLSTVMVVLSVTSIVLIFAAINA